MPSERKPEWIWSLPKYFLTEKEAVIRKLQNYGKVAMVGDGINDAVASDKSGFGYCHRMLERTWPLMRRIWC